MVYKSPLQISLLSPFLCPIQPPDHDNGAGDYKYNLRPFKHESIDRACIQPSSSFIFAKFIIMMKIKKKLQIDQRYLLINHVFIKILLLQKLHLWKIIMQQKFTIKIILGLILMRLIVNWLLSLT